MDVVRACMFVSAYAVAFRPNPSPRSQKRILAMAIRPKTPRPRPAPNASVARRDETWQDGIRHHASAGAVQRQGDIHKKKAAAVRPAQLLAAAHPTGNLSARELAAFCCGESGLPRTGVVKRACLRRPGFPVNQGAGHVTARSCELRRTGGNIVGDGGLFVPLMFKRHTRLLWCGVWSCRRQVCYANGINVF